MALPRNRRKAVPIRTRPYKYPNSPLYPWQRAVLNCNAKYRVLACGRGSGKTKIAIDDLLINMCDLVGNAAIICPESERQTIRVYWERLLEACEQYPFMVDKAVKWHNDSEHYVTLKNGNLIFLFSGSEQFAESLRGTEYIYILLDEFANLERWVWDDIIEPMTIRRKGIRVFFASTPNGVNNVFHNLYEGGRYGAQGDSRWSDYRSFHVTSYANPLQVEGGLDKIKERKGADSLVWRREYMAEFVGSSGAVFPKFGEKNITTKAIYYDGNGWDTYADVDFGFRKGITILYQVNRMTSNVNIFGEYLNIQRGFREVRPESPSQEQHLLTAQSKFKIQRIAVDCAGNQHSQETGQSIVGMLRQSGLTNVYPVPKQADDFRDYIEVMREMICDGTGNPHLFINPAECPYGVESLYNCKYPENPGANPHKYLKDDVYDHWVDAKRYGIKMLFPIDSRKAIGYKRGNSESTFVELE